MSHAVSKLAYKPVGMALGMAASTLSGVLFKQLWRRVGSGGGAEAPRAKDEEGSWTEILLAATLQGAIFAFVKAAVDRAGATGMRRLTGEWPA
jgi:hypothetical protein